MNSYQPKVSNTQKYEDSQGSHIVTTGKLILIEPGNPYDALQHESDRVKLLTISGKKVLPIIISETEEITKGDRVYGGLGDKFQLQIPKLEEGETLNAGEFSCYKVLALPEHFSDKHLQAIVNGKVKDGDNVLLKCDEYSNNDPLGGYAVKYNKKVYLDQQNHITLFPAKESLEEAATDYPNCASYGDTSQLFSAQKYAFMAGAEWAKNNNY